TWGCTGAAAVREGLFFSASLCLLLLLSAWDRGSRAVSSWGSPRAKSNEHPLLVSVQC
uniref:Uncharacterized protein n=1 Tax=Prolemur simus TaxID=1328070 RepID=A0A8C9DRT8_PROSS